MNTTPSILVADDEASMRRNIAELLQEEGYTVLEAADGAEAVSLARTAAPALVLLDINLPVMDGLSALRVIKQERPESVVIVFTAYGTSERTIEAMKAGAYDYIEKPFELEDFLQLIQHALAYREKSGAMRRSRERRAGIFPPDPVIVGTSAAMQEIFKLVGRIAPSDTTVLIQGESGTGKEMIADAIQRHSLRAGKPFIKVNCGALTESLLESEIFGHEKGAFTGAIAQRPGRFELASGGTLFLDEVDTMPPSLQVKLLRVLQHGTFERVGGRATLTVDVRLIAATNKDLDREVREGRFREDLFYRLNILHIRIPPLREHPEDIPTFVEYFLRKHAPGRSIAVSPEVLQGLRAYAWPGNVRELENVVQRSIVLGRGDVILPEHVPLPIHGSTPGGPGATAGRADLSLKRIVTETEREVIRKALQQTGGNRSRAAALLKINRRQLFAKIKQLRIDLRNLDR